MPVRKVSIENATHDEWMAIRSGTIGGSEAGAIVGLSPYSSPFAVWCEHTGRSKPFEGNLATEVGTYLEEFVAEQFTKATGLEVEVSNYIYFNDDFPSQHATPDRLVKPTDKYDLGGLKCGLEIKTTNAFGRFRDGSFPEIYYAQCVQYLSVMEYDVWFLAVLVANRELHIYEIRRDESYPVPSFVEGDLVATDGEIGTLRDACDIFLQMVKDDNPPLTDGSESATEALNEAYPEAEEGTEVSLADHQSEVNELATLLDEQKDLNGRIEALKNRIKSEMGECETGRCDRFTVSWKNSFSSGLDTKRLKAERPEIYESYYRKTPCRRFSVKRMEE